MMSTLPLYNRRGMSSSLLEYYARRVGEYDAVYAKPERQADLGRLRAAVAAELAGHDVLELACGTGYWTAVLAVAARSVEATDASERVLAAARRRPLPPGAAARVTFAPADAWDPPARAREASAVFAGFWLSHVPRQRLPEFFDRLAARLRLGTRLVFVDNRFVPGSSTPIARRDAAGNTYQRRRLADGGEHEILKNFPSPADLVAAAGGAMEEPRVMELDYYWLLSGLTRRGATS